MEIKEDKGRYMKIYEDRGRYQQHNIRLFSPYNFFQLPLTPFNFEQLAKL